MSSKKAPYGTWESPITAKSLVEKVTDLRELKTDQENLYWLEARPEEQGRCTSVREKDRKDIVPAPLYARTTVHEYGGNCGAVQNNIFYFTNFTDQHLYKVVDENPPQLLVSIPGLRFADFVISSDNRYLYSIQEDHRNKGECINSLVKIDTHTGIISPIAVGHDFYAYPRLNPDGTKLAYIAWDHPHMPWDETSLFVIDLVSKKTKKIAGKSEESISEPVWTPCGQRLSYISDKDGYWKIYEESATPLIDFNCDFTTPLWRVGVSRRTYVDSSDHSYLLTVATKKGRDFFVRYDRHTKQTYTYKEHEFTFIQELKTLGNQVVFIAKTPTNSTAIYKMDPHTGSFEVVKKSKDSLSIDLPLISQPQELEFPTTEGKTAYGFFYPPCNRDYTPKNPHEKPPLIVFTHGGPTAHMPPVLAGNIQFWTSRGFAVADINYGGSSGYGREYRNRLKRRWGIVDVDDCCSAAQFLAKSGLVDENRMAIQGGSAGGYTTLAALTFRSVFKTGASYFGVSDLSLLAEETHKFESRYLDSLIGNYPEEKERYIQYSPLYHTEQLSCPVLILQGAEDKIVLPNQAEKMYTALLKKQIPTTYVLYEKEQHGFRIAENIIHAIESELYFYQRIFKIAVHTPNPPIHIVNLD